MKHVIVILLIVAACVAIIFLPFVHGDYDAFAVGLSHIVQLAAFASLLLVPVGLLWLVLRKLSRHKDATARSPRYLKTLIYVVAVFIVLAAALGGFIANSRFAAILILVTGLFIVFMVRKKTVNLYKVPEGIVPYYLVFIPLSVVAIRLAFFEKLKDAATDFVIAQCEPLIQDIEAYQQTHGHYPVSLLSTIEDYKPSVAGVQRFHYERNGDGYNLYFEQVSEMLGTEEIVMYNKLDEHEMTVHNQDLLRIAPGDILRGYHRVANHPRTHWKIFYFD